MRKKLLIVDDEELIRKGIIARLSYLGFVFDGILEAESGTEALEAVKENGADIVISDIQMPDMDGLTFIREAKTVNPALRFLILSGYAEFAYAREALFLGVKAYLLKPLSNEELKNVMEKLLAEMERAADIQEKIVSGSRLKKREAEYSMEKKINTLLRLSLKDQKIDGNTGGRLLLAILTIDEKSCDRTFLEEDMELIRFAVRNVFNEVSPHRLLLVNSLLNREQMYVVFKSSGRETYSPDGMRREVELLFLQLRSVLEKKMGIYLTMAVSSPGRVLCKEMLQEAEAALRQRLLQGENNLYFFGDEELISEKQFTDMELYLLEQAMAESESEALRKHLDRLFYEEEVRHQYGVSYVRILLLRICNMLFKYYGTEIQQSMGAADMMRRFDTLEELSDIGKINSGLKSIISECMNGRRIQDSKARDKILLAAEYIKSHYRENMSVYSLAKRYHMSPSYFSTTFKKELERSAIHYMTEVRVERAMEYLKETTDSVAEIAEKVGYEDSQYFFRVFKKIAGITPLQYRQQNKQPPR